MKLMIKYPNKPYEIIEKVTSVEPSLLKDGGFKTLIVTVKNKEVLFFKMNELEDFGIRA